MGVHLKSRAEIAAMREAGRVVANILAAVREQVRPGVICTSINEEIVHGIPSRKRKLQEGDIIGLDFGIIREGWFGDSAITVAVGQIPEETEKLMRVTRESLELGIAAARPGNRIYDIGAAVQAHVEAHGYSVVRDFVGHGVGRRLHEEPQVPNYGPGGQGMRIKPGMVLAIEPMVNVGTWQVEELDDDWTAVTADGKLSAHFEHTIAVTEDGPVILTLPRGDGMCYPPPAFDYH